MDIVEALNNANVALRWEQSLLPYGDLRHWDVSGGSQILDVPRHATTAAYDNLYNQLYEREGLNKTEAQRYEQMYREMERERKQRREGELLARHGQVRVAPLTQLRNAEFTATDPADDWEELVHNNRPLFYANEFEGREQDLERVHDMVGEDDSNVNANQLWRTPSLRREYNMSLAVPKNNLFNKRGILLK
jgi:hypothetical protein